jgi:hypothetical protein
MFRRNRVERDDVDYILHRCPIVQRNDEREFGEYRTKRLILEHVDATAAVDAANRP